MIRSKTRARLTALLLAVSSIGVIAQIAEAPAARAAVAPQLTRYPYLTDVVQTYATVNFATDRSNTTAKLKYGRVGQESCTAHSVTASKTAIVVGTTSEYQWKAKLTGLSPNVKYCYRIFFGTTSIDLLGGDPSPQFWSALPAGSNQSYSFAVFGDWGDTDQQGNNPQQAALDASLGASGVRFALATGDTGYDSGSQLNYGDLNQTGFRVSSIFGPSFWPQAGDSVPLFSVPGNHGANATFFTNWPQAQAVSSLEREVPDGDVLLCEQLQVGERTEHVVRVQRGERAVLRVDRRNGAIPTSATPPRTGWTTRTAGSRTAPSTSGCRTICRRIRRS